MKTLLTQSGHAVASAESSREALEVLRREGHEAFDTVLTDYWMPGGTGVDLIRQVVAEDPTLSTILVTAAGEKRILTEVIRSGGSAYLDKPIRAPLLATELGRAIKRTRDQRRQRATAEAARALGRTQERLFRRHTAALGDRVELFFHSHTEASGDFLSVFTVEPRRWILLASDASGHDLSSAFHASYFHGLARGMVAQSAGLDAVFSHCNRLLLNDWPGSGEIAQSTAALGLLVDEPAGKVDIVAAGFPAPQIATADGWCHPLTVDAPSSPLGWFDDAPARRTVDLATGTITLWTDGLTDLAEKLDVDPLCLAHRFLRRHGDEAAVLRDSKDDILIVRLHLGSESRVGAVPLIHRRFHGGQAGEIDRIQQWFERSLKLLPKLVSEEALADIIVCARESILNALIHGCGRDPAKEVVVQMALEPAARVLRLRVIDPGTGHDFDLATHEQAAADQLLTEHRGLLMIHHLARQVCSVARGADVTMDFAV